MSDDQQILIIEKHSLWVRWFHWLNFPLLILMIWSGVLIYWANDAYIAIPKSVGTALNIEGRLAEGMGWHFFLMWPFIINGVLFLGYLALSGEWREFLPHPSTFREAILVTLHDLGLRKTAPVHDGKFNSAQRLAYFGVLVLALCAVLTGYAIYKPVQLGALTQALGGYEAARLEHFFIMILLSLFFIVHILQVARAGWNGFRAMVTGYEISHNDKK